MNRKIRGVILNLRKPEALAMHRRLASRHGWWDTQLLYSDVTEKWGVCVYRPDRK